MMDSKEISLIAMLGALSAALRVPFAAIPSVQPSTFLICSAGYSFGLVKGVILGLLTAVVSSIFLGFGPWTIFQGLAWGLAGASFGLIGRMKLPIWALAAIAFCWGYLFGFIMNLWYLLGFGLPQSVGSIIGLQIASFPMDTMHAIGNAAFFMLFGDRTLRIFKRFKTRFGYAT